MAFNVNSVQWIPTPTGIQVPAIAYKDSAGNLAIPQTPYVISASGLLLPAPVDANNNPLVTNAGSLQTSTPLQTAAVATGNGAILNVSSSATVGFEVSGTFVGTVIFEVSNSPTFANAYPVLVSQSGSTNPAGNTATAPGIYYAETVAVSYARARISAYTSGSITVTAVANAETRPSKTVAATITGSLTTDYFSGSTTITKDYSASPKNGFDISNDGTSNLTYMINSMTITLFPGEIDSRNFSTFTSVTVTTTVPYRAWGRS